MKVQPVVDSRTVLSNRHWRTVMRYNLTNALPRPVVVHVVQGGLWGDVRISDESLKSERPDAGDAAWNVLVPANGKAVLSATFETRY